MKKTDIAAYVWPAYSSNLETKRFWKGDMGEWETVSAAHPRFPGHRLPRIPEWGYVNEADPRIMEMEIDAALEYGVNVFIYDWYFYNDGFFLEHCLREGFLKARNVGKMKFFIMWANHDVNGVWNKDTASGDLLHKVFWSASVNDGQFDRICARLFEYFAHPSYYRIDGKPVLSIYDLDRLARDLGGADALRRAVERLREGARTAGIGEIHLQSTLRCETYADGLDTKSVQQRTVEAAGVDSITYYQFIHMDYIKDRERYCEAVDRCFGIMENVVRKYSIPFAPHISLGWDNNSRFHDHVYRNLIQEATAEEFEDACLRAKRMIETYPNCLPLVTVNSWNEWTEGSYLEPDTVNGYRYLEIVKKVFGR